MSGAGAVPFRYSITWLFYLVGKCLHPESAEQTPRDVISVVDVISALGRGSGESGPFRA